MNRLWNGYIEVSQRYFELLAATTPQGSQINNYYQFRARKTDPPQWHTPNRVVWSDGKTELLQFRAGQNPVVIVAPEAGHSSHIMDYGPGQSLVECAMRHHSGGVYGLNKLSAKPEHKDLGIEYAFSSLWSIIQYINEPVKLVGLCQGGWQSAVVAARHPEMVKSLILAASPIDFHAGDSIVKQFVDVLPLSFFEMMVKINGGLMPGAGIVSGFVLGSLSHFIDAEIKTLDKAGDDSFEARARRFDDWYLNVLKLPGRQYYETVKELFFRNNLLQYGDLYRLDMPVHLVAGSKDNITPPEQLFAMQRFAPHATIETVDAGHIGVFMASKVVRDTWSRIFSEIPVMVCEVQDVAA